MEQMEQDERIDLFTCSVCGASLLEYGITEMDITFNPNGHIEFGSADTHDFDDQWVVCRACDAELHDRTAIELIDEHQKELYQDDGRTMQNLYKA